MKNLLQYLNPMQHLGERKSPLLFPFFTMAAAVLLLEFIFVFLLRDPEAVGVYAVFPFVALIIYFAFRAGRRGGFIAAGITITYYFYIIYSRNYTAQELENAINTTLVLAVLYFLIGSVIGWLKERIDILVELEAGEKRRLQAILQQLPVGVLVADKDGKIEHGNKQVETLLGRPMRENIKVGKDTIENGLYNNQVVKPEQWPLARALKTGHAILKREYVLQRDDGKQVFLEVSASPIKNRAGRMVAVASVLTDITAQKVLEQRKDDFINVASHELKTPLTSIKLYLQALTVVVGKRKNKKEKELVSHLTDQTERLQKIVEDLLDVSRVQTGKMTLTKERFHLDGVISEIVDGLGHTSQHKIIFQSKKPIIISADKFRIYQVLTNLITNAIKYSEDGEEIYITCKKNREQVTVSVQDFGMGIAKNQQKKIFERLYQAGDDSKSVFSGFGMGLYIAKEIVRRHRGRIWVESEEGKGSTFFFSLPLANKK